MADDTIRTLCQICHQNCGLIVRSGPEGSITVEGDPDHPMNRGRCCVKAAAIPEIIRSGDRLTAPLKKTSSGFQKISWKEAILLAADRLGEIRSQYGPLSLVRCIGAPVSYQCRDGFLQFMGEFGSSNLTGAGSLCMVPRMTAFRTVTGTNRTEPDYDNASLVIFWAGDPVASERFGSYSAHNGLKQIIPRLKKRGARIICIDPFRSMTVRESDEWVRINPGTDAALGLAMIHVIIREELYDKGFVAGYTKGFDKLAKHVEPFTPQWAEGPTGLQSGSIEKLARTYATTKPAAIHEGNGLDMYANGLDAVRTIAMLISLTGNLDARGGNVFMPFVRQSVLPTTLVPREKRIGYKRFPLFPEQPFPAVKESLLGHDADRPRAMIVHHSNPVLVQANQPRTREALQKLDFLMVCDIFPTATSEMADLVLPIASDFETHGYRAYSSIHGGFAALARPVAPPLGESRPVFEVEYEIAERMGLHPNYPFHDTRSWIEFMLKPSGIGFERLDAEQIVHATPSVQYRKYERDRFQTQSGKVEFYSQRFESRGAGPLPLFTEPAGEALNRESLTASGFPLLGTSRRPAQFVHTKLKNTEVLSRIYPEPFVYIHPHDAAERNVGDGDQVEVTSPQGSISLKARVTEDAKAGIVWVDFGWGNPTDRKASINVLVNDRFTDPVSGSTPNRLFPCQVNKSGRE